MRKSECSVEQPIFDDQNVACVNRVISADAIHECSTIARYSVQPFVHCTRFKSNFIRMRIRVLIAINNAQVSASQNCLLHFITLPSGVRVSSPLTVRDELCSAQFGWFIYKCGIHAHNDVTIYTFSWSQLIAWVCCLFSWPGTASTFDKQPPTPNDLNTQRNW